MADLRPYLTRIGWSASEMGRYADYPACYACDMASGRRPTPPALLAWLKAMARCVERHPPLPHLRGAYCSPFAWLRASVAQCVGCHPPPPRQRGRLASLAADPNAPLPDRPRRFAP